MFEQLHDDFDNSQANEDDQREEQEDEYEEEEEQQQSKPKKSSVNFNNFFPPAMLFFMLYGPYGVAAYNFQITNCLTMDTKSIDMAAKAHKRLNEKSLRGSVKEENDHQRYVSNSDSSNYTSKPN